MMHRNGWNGNYGCSPMAGNMAGHMFGGWSFMIMFGIILIIIAIVLFTRRKNNTTNENQVMNTLKELYVKGEITEEEYLKRKDVIQR